MNQQEIDTLIKRLNGISKEVEAYDVPVKETSKKTERFLGIFPTKRTVRTVSYHMVRVLIRGKEVLTFEPQQLEVVKKSFWHLNIKQYDLEAKNIELYENILKVFQALKKNL